MMRFTLAVLALGLVGACASSPAAPETDDVLYAYRIPDAGNGDAVLTEIARTENTSTLEVDIPRSYGAVGGGLTIVAVLTELAHARGFTHFVELQPRERPAVLPTTGYAMVVGLCNGAEPADLAVFDEHFHPPDPTKVFPVDLPADRLRELRKFRTTQ